MRCYATYCGDEEYFGVEAGKRYEVEVRFGMNGDASYIWVEIPELPDYMMPYLNIGMMLEEWDFQRGFYSEQVQAGLQKRWVQTYAPAMQ